MRFFPLLPFSPTVSSLARGARTSKTLTSSTDGSDTEYVPPKVWTWQDENELGGTFGPINRPTAGPRFTKELEVGKHPFQLYSLATPNGQKVAILLEELLQAGVAEAEYDAWPIEILKQDQFASGFVDVNPNSKIPALMDYSSNKDQPVRLFESGSILLYLAEKFNKFLPTEKRTQVLNWLFWQMSSAPYVGGGFGHFFQYAPTKQQYPLDRYTMETKRQLDVLNRQLADNKYIVGDEYTIADIAIFPWHGRLVLGDEYGAQAATFLNVEKEYPNAVRWAREMEQRPAVKRGRVVNRTRGDKAQQLAERHDASDFDKLSL